MFLDHIFFTPPRTDGQGKNIMTLQLRWAGHKNSKDSESDLFWYNIVRYKCVMSIPGPSMVQSGSIPGPSRVDPGSLKGLLRVHPKSILGPYRVNPFSFPCKQHSKIHLIFNKHWNFFYPVHDNLWIIPLAFRWQPVFITNIIIH